MSEEFRFQDEETIFSKAEFFSCGIETKVRIEGRDVFKKYNGLNIVFEDILASKITTEDYSERFLADQKKEVRYLLAVFIWCAQYSEEKAIEIAKIISTIDSSESQNSFFRDYLSSTIPGRIAKVIYRAVSDDTLDPEKAIRLLRLQTDLISGNPKDFEGIYRFLYESEESPLID